MKQIIPLFPNNRFFYIITIVLQRVRWDMSMRRKDSPSKKEVSSFWYKYERLFARNVFSSNQQEEMSKKKNLEKKGVNIYRLHGFQLHGF